MSALACDVQKRVTDPLATRVMDNCELPSVGAGNQTTILQTQSALLPSEVSADQV